MKYFWCVDTHSTFRKTTMKLVIWMLSNKSAQITLKVIVIFNNLHQGSFNNYVDRILPFFDTPSPPRPCVDSFYNLSVDKKTFFDPLPPHWMAPYIMKYFWCVDTHSETCIIDDSPERQLPLTITTILKMNLTQKQMLFHLKALIYRLKVDRKQT